MTKRWLSLVVVLTLLSTLFTGVAYAVLPSPVQPPKITEENATTDPNGAKRVIITSENTDYLTGGVTEDIYYTYSKGTAPADPDTNSYNYAETGPLVLDQAGTWYVKAISYMYEGTTTKNSTVASSGPITVAGEATKVTIQQSAMTITGSGSVTFTATVTPASKAADLVWVLESDLKGVNDPEKYNAKGEVQADGSYKVTVNGKVGTFTVKAKIDGVEKATATVRVDKQDVTSFDLPSTITVAVGEKVEFTGGPVPANATYGNLKIDGGYGSAATSIATIEETKVDYSTGKSTFTVTGKNKGTTTITFGSYNYADGNGYWTAGPSRKVTVTVTERTNTAPAPSFDAADGKVFTKLDDKITIKGNYDGSYLKTQYSLDQSGSWKDYSDALSIDVLGLTNTTFTIWAKNVVENVTGNPYESDSEVVKATFTSEIAVDSVKLAKKGGSWSYIDKAEQTIAGSGKLEIQAAVKPDNESNGGSFAGGTYKSYAKDPSITFTSSDTTVAKVEYKKGDTSKRIATVTGVGAGTATITATAVNGKKDYFKVTVNDVKPTTINVYKDNAGNALSALTLRAGEYANLTAEVVNGSNLAFDQSVTWARHQRFRRGIRRQRQGCGLEGKHNEGYDYGNFRQVWSEERYFRNGKRCFEDGR